MVGADGDGDRQPDRRPQRVTTADPVPEHEHVVGLDAEALHSGGVGGHGHEVAADGRLAQRVDQPRAGRGGVGHRLLGGEGLGGDDEERRGRIDRLERLAEVRAVDVGDEVHPRALAAVRRQCVGDHRWPEIGAADADVDDVADAIAAGAGPRARTDRGAERVDVRPGRVDLGHHVASTDDQRLRSRPAQRDVQHGALFGLVDRRAGEHPVALRLDTRGRGQLDQQTHGLFGDALLGAVHQQIVDAVGELVEPARIVREQRAQVHVAHPVAMLFQTLPHVEGSQFHGMVESTAGCGPRPRRRVLGQRDRLTA